MTNYLKNLDRTLRAMEVAFEKAGPKPKAKLIRNGGKVELHAPVDALLNGTWFFNCVATVSTETAAREVARQRRIEVEN